MATKTKNSLKVLSVKICRDVDQNADLSYLGEYSDRPGDNCIDRQERGDQERGEYRYCNITISAEESGSPESVEQDYQRLESYNRGNWCMVGVWAEAEIAVNGVVNAIRSGGLWGIESDSDDSYFRTTGMDELEDLRAQLKALGFSDKKLEAAFADVDLNPE